MQKIKEIFPGFSDDPAYLCSYPYLAESSECSIKRKESYSL
jgi:hypothetical protein